MTIDAAQKCLARLKASYQAMKPLDELTTQVYLEEIGSMRYDDFCAGAKEVVRSQKFFPSVAELVEATGAAARKRFDQQDHVEREERLALMSGETAIMDPASAIHGHIVGPHHQKFVDMISGRIKLPAPEWMSKSAPRTESPGDKSMTKIRCPKCDTVLARETYSTNEHYCVSCGWRGFPRPLPQSTGHKKPGGRVKPLRCPNRGASLAVGGRVGQKLNGWVVWCAARKACDWQAYVTRREIVGTAILRWLANGGHIRG